MRVFVGAAGAAARGARESRNRWSTGCSLAAPARREGPARHESEESGKPPETWLGKSTPASKRTSPSFLAFAAWPPAIGQRDPGSNASRSKRNSSNDGRRQSRAARSGSDDGRRPEHASNDGGSQPAPWEGQPNNNKAPGALAGRRRGRRDAWCRSAGTRQPDR